MLSDLFLMLFYAELNSQIRLRFRLRPDLEKSNPVHPYLLTVVSKRFDTKLLIFRYVTVLEWWI